MVLTQRGGFVLFADDVASANRALLRHLEWAPWVTLPDDAHHFRNHVATAFHQHFVADFDAQPGDFVLIVQRGSRHGDAADRHGPEVRYRRQCARPAHLHADVLDDGGRLPCGVLVGDGPTRGFGRPPKLLLRSDGIHLHYDAIDFIRQALAPAFPLPAECKHFVHAVA